MGHFKVTNKQLKRALEKDKILWPPEFSLEAREEVKGELKMSIKEDMTYWYQHAGKPEASKATFDKKDSALFEKYITEKEAQIMKALDGVTETYSSLGPEAIKSGKKGGVVPRPKGYNPRPPSMRFEKKVPTFKAGDLAVLT